MLKHEFKVAKQYLVDCCQNGVEVDPFVAIDDDIDEAMMGLIKQIVYSKSGLLPDNEIADMVKELDRPNSPEQLLYLSAQKEIDELCERVRKTVNTKIESTLDSTLNPTQRRNTIKRKLEQAINAECVKLLATKLSQIKTQIAEKQHERKQIAKMERDIGAKLTAIDNATAGNDFLTMTLKMNSDPLYSQDMVQQLIRLRLNPSNPIKNTYPREEQHQPIIMGQRIWLGLFELCDLVANDLQNIRMNRRAILKSALVSALEQGQGKEIYISVRPYSRDGNGHYFMLALIPDLNKPGSYLMRHIDSLPVLSGISQKDRGCPGELLAVATECNISISDFESMVLIAQPTNQGCGPTHVETTSAIMTQQSLYGEVPVDYTKTSINTRKFTETVLTAHMRALVENDITRPMLIDRGEEESIFRLVEKGKDRNEFGYIPPTLEHLQDETTSIERLKNPLINTKIHERDHSNETPLMAAINNSQFQLAKTMLLMTTDAAMKNKYSAAELDAMIEKIRSFENNHVLLAKLRAAKSPEGKTSSFLYNFDDFADSDLSTVLNYIHQVESQRQPLNGMGGKENPQEENQRQNEFAKRFILEQYKLKEYFFNWAVIASVIGVLLPIISHIIIWTIYFCNRPEVSRVEVDRDAYVAMKNNNRTAKKSENKFSVDDPIQNRSAVRDDQSKNAEENFGTRFRKVVTADEDNPTLFLFFTNEQQERHCLDKIHDYEYQQNYAASPGNPLSVIR